MGAPSPDITFDEVRRLARATASRTKHGPGGSGHSGPCDADCVKCLAERWLGAALAEHERGIGKLFNDEIAAANASADAKETALDKHGYGGKAPVSPDLIVGLADFVPTTKLAVIERYAGATVDIPGGSIELGLQRGRGEPVIIKRAEMRRICEEEALALNGDDIDDDSAARLSDRIDARFAATWPTLAWFIEIWNARERLTQVYHRWQWPGDAR